jgi:CSLREA domain-containing protein
MKYPLHYPGHSGRVFLSVVCCLAWMAGFTPAPLAQGNTITATVIAVNTTVDELNSDGDCSLREAVRAANADAPVDACTAGSGLDTILLAAGIYALTKVGYDDVAESGDLDVTSSLTIIGVSTRDTVINGNQTDRIFEIIGSTTLQLSKMTLRDGWVRNDGNYGGGAILNDSTGTLELYQVVLRANSSDNIGGAIDNAGTARLNYVTLDINQTASETTVCAGGAIYNDGSLVINNSLFSYNTAYNPSSTDYGGGLFNGDIVTLVNVTFSHNTADWGGGFFNQGDEANFYNVTFASNTTAIHNTSSLRIKNSIVAHSTVGANCGGEGTISSLGHNIDSGISCNFDLENIDPLMGPLANNLGPTSTHALLAGSPAIDNGDSIDCPDIDQRGAFRPADGDLSGTRVCDIGAYEYLAPLPTLIYLPILGK